MIRNVRWGTRPIMVASRESAPPDGETQDALSPEASLYRALYELERRPLVSPEETVYDLLDALRAILPAALGTCVVAPRIADLPPDDPLGGYRLLRVYHSSAETAHSHRTIESWTDVPLQALHEPCTIHTARQAGSNRVVFVREQVDLEKYRPPLMEQLQTIDMLTATVTFHPWVEIHFALSRREPFELFDESVRRLMLAAVNALTPFAARLACFHGFLEGQQALQPNERRVLAALLGPLSEKEIAAQMSMTAGALHQYVVRVYRKLGARTRAELVASWIALAHSERST